MKKRVALILDNLYVAEWQRAALENANNNIEIVLLINCQNTKTKKRFFRNFLYYILNIFALRNPFTRRVLVDISSKKVINFDSIYEGAWQLLPPKVYEAFKKEKIDLIVKFGMNLLRIDENKLSTPILSYHHGDPSEYRGRPAGFYEMLDGKKSSGIVVQQLTNKLDAGVIYAFAESKIIDFSYRRTAINFYSNSVPLLNKAVININNKVSISRSVEGKNYKLPSNLKVIQFVSFMLVLLFRKIFYGLFFEKRWNVAILNNNLNLNGDEVIKSKNFQTLPILNGYTFYADCFFSEDDSKIRLEALNNKTGLGDILEIDVKNLYSQKLIFSGNHYSYPSSFQYENDEYLLPEVASHSLPYICNAESLHGNIFYLKGLEDKRIVDATMFSKESIFYLFFGEYETADDILHLWISDSPFGIFTPHPMSPINISPNNSRMGGKLIFHKGRLLRFGQNNAREYGESIVVNEVIELSSDLYEERKIASLAIDSFKGPHSIGFSKDFTQIIIDYYVNKFSLLAGIRRIKGKFNTFFSN